jgi:hypothetical protein
MRILRLAMCRSGLPSHLVEQAIRLVRRTGCRNM